MCVRWILHDYHHWVCDAIIRLKWSSSSLHRFQGCKISHLLRFLYILFCSERLPSNLLPVPGMAAKSPPESKIQEARVPPRFKLNHTLRRAKYDCRTTFGRNRDIILGLETTLPLWILFLWSTSWFTGLWKALLSKKLECSSDHFILDVAHHHQSHTKKDAEFDSWMDPLSNVLLLKKYTSSALHPRPKFIQGMSETLLTIRCVNFCKLASCLLGKRDFCYYSELHDQVFGF
jgi:hypothetical protein